MVAKWVGLRVYVFGSVCKKIVSVWVKSGKAWSLRSEIKKTVTLQWCLCVFTSVFHCEWCGVLFSAFVGQRVVCVIECGCVFIMGAKWLSGWCVFALCRLGSLAVQVWKCAGGERCVDFGDTKRGQEINSKR